MSGFRELKVWQKSKDLAVTIYRITQEGEFSRDFGFLAIQTGCSAPSCKCTVKRTDVLLPFPTFGGKIQATRFAGER
jgi:hypothetical protein